MRLIGVTEALSVLDRGFGDIPPRERERYMEMGREFHSYSLGWVAMGGSLPFDPPMEIAPSVERFQEWYRTAVEEVLAVEFWIEDKVHGYRGRLDLVARIKGDRTASLIDLKRSYAMDKPTGFQLEAYRRPAERKLRRKIGRRIGWGAVSGPTDFKEDEKDWLGFMYCLNLKRILGERRDGDGFERF